VAVSIAPIIPFVTEPEIERILEAVHEAGAVSAHYTVLRLPWEVAPLFKEWLQAHFPERAQRVMNRVREMRGGKDYDSDFATRMKGEGVWAELIRQRVKIASERLGLTGHSRFHRMDCSQFTPPLVVPPLGARAKAAPMRDSWIYFNAARWRSISNTCWSWRPSSRSASARWLR
jgi:hypothetical protein